MIGKQNDLTVISIKDYIKNPKESGYKSYHMLVTVPIFLSDRVIDTKVEIQIRTMAMDFWASLEHKIYYKFEGNAPGYISRDLRECSDIVSFACIIASFSWSIFASSIETISEHSLRSLLI